MNASNPEIPPRRQAVVVRDSGDGSTLIGRAGTSEFQIGGPDRAGGTASGANPYDLLSASLAACTAMTIRLHARHKKYQLSHIEVAVSYHHAADGGRTSFERIITLEGSLSEDERARLLQVASICPVGKTLGLGSDIHTRLGNRTQSAVPTMAADYIEDLTVFSLVNLDPD